LFYLRRRFDDPSPISLDRDYYALPWAGSGASTDEPPPLRDLVLGRLKIVGKSSEEYEPAAARCDIQISDGQQLTIEVAGDKSGLKVMYSPTEAQQQANAARLRKEINDDQAKLDAKKKRLKELRAGDETRAASLNEISAREVELEARRKVLRTAEKAIDAVMRYNTYKMSVVLVESIGGSQTNAGGVKAEVARIGDYARDPGR
jgi:hypothetical protein